MNIVAVLLFQDSDSSKISSCGIFSNRCQELQSVSYRSRRCGVCAPSDQKQITLLILATPSTKTISSAIEIDLISQMRKSKNEKYTKHCYSKVEY